MKDKDLKIDFIGIGEAKCGTTWLYECLAEHPEIFIVSSKTLPYAGYFFNLLPRDRKAYCKIFRKASLSQKKGEIKEGYLKEGKKIAQRIKRHNKDTKLIVLLRNPAERAYSQYLSAKSLKGKDWQDIKEASKERPNIIERGYYYKHLNEYFEYFPKNQVLILFFEDLKQNPLATIQKVYSFLGVNPNFNPMHSKVKTNPTSFKLTRLGRFLHQRIIAFLKRFQLGWRLKNSKFVRRMFYQFSSFYAEKSRTKAPFLDEDTKNYLKALYIEDINKLEKLINCDLSKWK